MLNGKYWLIPGDRVIDVTTGEDAIHARKVMLRLSDATRSITIKNMLSPLTPRQIACHRRREISEDILNFLSTERRTNDPRTYAINTWGWIRARLPAERRASDSGDLMAKRCPIRPSYRAGTRMGRGKCKHKPLAMARK